VILMNLRIICEKTSIKELRMSPDRDLLLIISSLGGGTGGGLLSIGRRTECKVLSSIIPSETLRDLILSWTGELPVRAPPPHMDELEREYPEIVELREKLRRGELDSRDEWNLRELCEATGWDEDDVKDELVNIDKDPAERGEVYVNLFNKYYGEARRLRENGDDVQAAEKLWGAITALVKAYSCRKRVFVEHWGRRKLNRFVENNVEEELKEKFSDLLTFGGELHEHFFERHLPGGKFDRRWNQCIRLIDELKLQLNRRQPDTV